ncbi:MAG: hypothetical protein U0800_12470 [Isosphaeraceae bacterium]
MTRVRFRDFDCTVQKRYYGNGRVALSLVDEEGPIATATVNLPAVKLGPNQVAIKSYAEHEGLLEALVAAGVVKSTGQTVRSGFVEVPVCELQPPFREPEQTKGRTR